MTNRYREAMEEEDKQKERYFNPVRKATKRQPQPQLHPQPQSEPEMEQQAQPEPEAKGRDYIVEVNESMSRDTGITFIEPPTRRERKKTGKITSNFLKGGPGAKWILHKQINELVKKGCTRKAICKELNICRMTLWRHLNEY